MTDALPLTECQARHIYRIRSRNLVVAVFRPPTGFMGIREKFGDLYLFEEFYADGSRFGTVEPVEEVGVLPDDIEMRSITDTECQECGLPAAYDKAVYDRQIAEGKKPGFADFVSPWGCEGNCEKTRPGSRTYAPLFEYLAEIEKGLGIFPEVPDDYVDPRTIFERMRRDA